MSDIFNLQNDSCENIEIIHSETISDTAETSELPHANPAPGSTKKKSKPQEKRKEKVNAIHASTEMYCTSTKEMALAVKRMDEAISQLADALKYLAMGLGELKIKTKIINN
ncbi:hypothetical protein JTB14_036684 [Gonioctena quinquepunctata]|nr:hypothetical protein JTB14_036684 [Gonioctena quinquepunctata]